MRCAAVRMQELPRSHVTVCLFLCCVANVRHLLSACFTHLSFFPPPIPGGCPRTSERRGVVGTIARCFITRLKPCGMVLRSVYCSFFFLFFYREASGVHGLALLRRRACVCACVNWLMRASLSRTACSDGSPSVPSLVAEVEEVKLSNSWLSKRCCFK